MDKDDKYLLRFDGWRNTITGQGTGRDKTEYTTFGIDPFLTDDKLDSLYSYGEMVARICEAFPEQYFKKDFDIRISVNDNYDKELSEEIKSQLLEIGVKEHLVSGAVWDNVFGGCGIFIGINDRATESLAEPLVVSKGDEITHLTVMDKRDLSPISFYRDPSNRNYGKHELLQVTSNYSSDLVHESRFLLYTGLRVSNRKRIELNGFGLSFIQRCYRALKAYGTSFQNLETLLSDANQGVFKFKNFMSLIANSDYSKIQARLAAMDMQRSVQRAIVVDADNEDFERQHYTWSGIEKPYYMMMLRLSAITNIPITILMGREPAGLNATGESDHNIFYDKVESQQKEKVAPRIKRLVDLCCQSRGITNAYVQVSFEPLIQMSLVDKVEAYLKAAQADKIYYDIGVLSEDEISTSRFTSDGWSINTQIDRELRERIRDAEQKAKTLETSLEITDNNDPLEALNGAQMKSIVDIVGLIDAEEGSITSNQAKGILKIAIPGISDLQVNSIVNK